MTQESYARALADVAAKLARPLAAYLLPVPCLACQVLIERPEGTLGLCPKCELKLVPACTLGACVTCGMSLRGGLATPESSERLRCRRCRRRPSFYRRLLWGWEYQDPFDTVITALKFGRLDYLGQPLGTRLAARYAEVLTGFQAVVPVPLHWWRLLRRGYDQAEILGGAVAKGLGLPLWSALRRRRATRAQSLLPFEERQKNTREAFAISRWPRRSLTGAKVILVDDVATTGATLEAAAKALRDAGVAEVVALVAARAPSPAER